MVRRRDRVTRALAAGRVLARPVSEPRDNPWLVLRDPARNPVAQARGDDLDVLGERLDRLADRPAAAVLERLRQVPVVERRERLDPVLEELVDQVVVEVQSRRVHATAPVRDDARPGDREPVRVEPELAHQAHVFRVAVVGVARDPAVIAVRDRSRSGRKPVPDALPAAVLAHRSLDLVRRGRSPPEEVGGEGSVGHVGSSLHGRALHCLTGQGDHTRFIVRRKQKG